MFIAIAHLDKIVLFLFFYCYLFNYIIYSVQLSLNKNFVKIKRVGEFFFKLIMKDSHTHLKLFDLFTFNLYGENKYLKMVNNFCNII